MLDDQDLSGPTALVMGRESGGLRRERWDFPLRIPLAGRRGSLDVSVAIGVTMFEAVRQRAENHADQVASAPQFL